MCCNTSHSISWKKKFKKVTHSEAKLVTYSKDTPMIDSANMLLTDMLTRIGQKIVNRKIRNSKGRMGFVENGDIVSFAEKVGKVLVTVTLVKNESLDVFAG